MSIGAWSEFAGATRSRIVDLIISNLFNVCAVVGAVLLFAAVGSPLIWLGAALAVASLIILGWLMRRDMSRRRALLSTYQAPRIVVLVAVAAGLHRPATWRCGLDLGRYRARDFRDHLRADGASVADQGDTGSRTASWLSCCTEAAVQSDFRRASRSGGGGSWRSAGSLGRTRLVLPADRHPGTMSAVIMVGYAIRAVSISRNSAIGVRKALQQYQPEFCVYYAARSGARYQLGMWLPYLERLNRDLS
jgi:hypothetical protein